MEEHIEFNFIYSNDAVRVKTFLGSVPRSIECINYMDIFNKLTKNDFYQYEPSDAVVSSYLMRQLQNAISRNISTTIFYVLGNLDKETISGIQEYVETLSDKPITYKMYHSPDIIVNGTAGLFADIIEFE
jgi:hypothetical protein|tara:strand:+ start:1122 stop:1511 length:390 start_codon:yes stop_codon:yes gene_type:complete